MANVSVHQSTAWKRLERRLARSVRYAWLPFIFLCTTMLSAGSILGYRAHSLQGGIFTATAVIALCVVYAIIVAPWQVARNVRAQLGQFPQAEDRIRRLLQPLCIKAKISMPRVVVIPSSACNAFAAGLFRRSQCVGVTSGALQLLSDRQLTAVLAHEVSHLRRKDTLYLGWWVAFLGIIVTAAMLLFSLGASLTVSSGITRRKDEENSAAFGWIMMILAIVAGMSAIVIIQLWLRADSRRRENLADEHAVILTGSALDLASALTTLKNDRTELEGTSAVSMMFAFHPTPVEHWWQRLFDTHPNIDRRIKKLQSLAREMGELE